LAYFGVSDKPSQTTISNNAQSSGNQSPAINAEGNVEYRISNETRIATPVTLSLSHENLGKHARHLRFAFDRSEYISPLIVADLIQGLAESDETTVAVDIEASQGSEEYFSDFEIENLPSGRWVWHTYQKEELDI